MWARPYRWGKRPNEAYGGWAPGRHACPWGDVLVVVTGVAPPHPHHLAGPRRVARDPLDSGGIDPRDGGEKGPLVRKGGEPVVDEDGVPLLPRTVLEREGDQVTEAARGRVSWFGKRRS